MPFTNHSNVSRTTYKKRYIKEPLHPQWIQIYKKKYLTILKKKYMGSLMGNEPWPIGVCPCPNGRYWVHKDKKNTFFFIFKPADGNDS